MTYLPLAFWCLWVFLLGCGIGSFLNVLIARLPYEKSIIWPGSRCFTCFRPIRFMDNLPIIGYLRLWGKCRMCGAKFSARYLWIEIGTGLAFIALFYVELIQQATGGPVWLAPWHHAPGLRFSMFADTGGPKLSGWLYFVCHAFLLSALIASAVIDLKHRIIPAQITYVGTFIGIIVSVIFPWPWPSTCPPELMSNLPIININPWIFDQPGVEIPTGIALWPVWGPPPEWAPAGSPQLGLITSLVGAAAGMAIGRGIKMAFEMGFGQEALGLGDADLLMMAGSFLGWQAVTLALPVGAVITLFVVIPMMVYSKLRGRSTETQLPFGPGIVAGIITCWFGWPWLGMLVKAMFFDRVILGFVAVMMFGGLLISGLFLRRKPQPEGTKT